MAELGIFFPPSPLPAKPPAPKLASVPYHYARVVKENAPVFISLEDAIRGENVFRRIEPGFDFVTYIDQAEVDGKRYFMIDQGIWMRGSDLSRISVTSSFQGLIFQETPKNAFGWMRNQAEIRRTPGYEPQDYTGKTLNRYDLVQVYKAEKVGDMDCYFSPDQWVRPPDQACASALPPGEFNKRWIEIAWPSEPGRLCSPAGFCYPCCYGRGAVGRFGAVPDYKRWKPKPCGHDGAIDFYYLEDVPKCISTRRAPCTAPSGTTGLAGRNPAAASTCRLAMQTGCFNGRRKGIGFRLGSERTKPKPGSGGGGEIIG
jgi:hypothetical protein